MVNYSLVLHRGAFRLESTLQQVSRYMGWSYFKKTQTHTDLYLRRHRRLWRHISIITVLLKRNQKDGIIKWKLWLLKRKSGMELQTCRHVFCCTHTDMIKCACTHQKKPRQYVHACITRWNFPCEKNIRTRITLQAKLLPITSVPLIFSYWHKGNSSRCLFNRNPWPVKDELSPKQFHLPRIIKPNCAPGTPLECSQYLH